MLSCNYLPAHVEKSCSSAQCAEIIAEHFSSISQEYEPLNLTKLPHNVPILLSNANQSLAPKLTTTDVHKRIIEAKKPNGLFPGDLPKKLVHYCAATLSVPVTAVYTQISNYALFPPQLKIEHQLAQIHFNAQKVIFLSIFGQ
jgi:hypothetical protein